jgi:hypothetical protein
MKVFNFNRETEAGLAKYQALKKTDSWLFQAVEKEFDSWIDSSNPSSEYEDMYFSEEAIYTKKGAIQGAIELIFEFMDEEKLPFVFLNDNRLDLTSAFSD